MNYPRRRPLMSTRQMSEYVNVSESKLNKDRVYGGGYPYLKLGHLVRYDPEVVDAHQATLQRTSTTENPPSPPRFASKWTRPAPTR
jgi:hypothetical protein